MYSVPIVCDAEAVSLSVHEASVSILITLSDARVGGDDATPLLLPVEEADALALPMALGISGCAGEGADSAAPLLLGMLMTDIGSLWLVD